MNGFIEVTYNHEQMLVNVAHIISVEKRFHHKDHESKECGCSITFRVGHENERDTSIIATDSYDDVKNKIVTAVGKS